jgi:hypothetical protein
LFLYGHKAPPVTLFIIFFHPSSRLQALVSARLTRRGCLWYLLRETSNTAKNL